MNSYYEDTLYPLQDKVLSLLNSVGDFYLTGGTALSRFYYHHRYSDDLDLFTNEPDTFIFYYEKAISKLSPLTLTVNQRTDTFCSITIAKILKVDFICDTGKHLGETIIYPQYDRVDNWQNILANKITAIISRDEPKDVVDIWQIATCEKVNWKEIYTTANSKAVGIFPPLIAEKLSTFPLEMLKIISWVGKPPEKTEFKNDLERVIDQMLAV